MILQSRTVEKFSQPVVPPQALVEKNQEAPKVPAPINEFILGTPIQGAYCGICPRCGTPVKWRRARKTGELYRGCDNYEGGCRYHERRY